MTRCVISLAPAHPSHLVMYYVYRGLLQPLQQPTMGHREPTKFPRSSTEYASSKSDAAPYITASPESTLYERETLLPPLNKTHHARVILVSIWPRIALGPSSPFCPLNNRNGIRWGWVRQTPFFVVLLFYFILIAEVIGHSNTSTPEAIRNKDECACSCDRSLLPFHSLDRIMPSWCYWR